jgi:ATP-dependent DNA ligase
VGNTARIWSRRGTALTEKFPNAVAAAIRQLAEGIVCDGELVVWSGERLDFDALQEGMVNTAATVGVPPPLQLSPVTSDPDEAREWLDAFKTAGVEGLVVKGASTRYQPGRRDWA